ncbi:MAG: cupin domain-containing protein [Candidatus Mcinerneyibacterium aminivorans]|uniref:Cupin domain-containing protein n=1 Tax=Candidatus Mcinerneyibacterium aminivorans TaxID=2703815 RepID=A0A5D0MK10_9BACT|nr:MAG: cupin domain-containing protein [Candidatus Mcinerneyibacterium aminivorans]
MIVKKYKDVKEEKVTMEGAKGAHIQWLISDKDDADNFAMRRFRIEKDGYTPFHKHPHEHETYILSGEGVMVTEDGEKEISEGSFVFVKPYEKHQFKNTGDKELIFLCMIPMINKEC